MGNYWQNFVFVWTDRLRHVVCGGKIIDREKNYGKIKANQVLKWRDRHYFCVSNTSVPEQNKSKWKNCGWNLEIMQKWLFCYGNESMDVHFSNTRHLEHPQTNLANMFGRRTFTSSKPFLTVCPGFWFFLQGSGSCPVLFCGWEASGPETSFL